MAELAVSLTGGLEERVPQDERLLKGLAAIRQADDEAGQLFQSWLTPGTALYALSPDAFAETLTKSPSGAGRGWPQPAFFYARRALRSYLGELNAERGVPWVSARITHVLEKTASLLTQSPVTPKMVEDRLRQLTGRPFGVVIGQVEAYTGTPAPRFDAKYVRQLVASQAPIWLFGSLATGVPTLSSDIDLMSLWPGLGWAILQIPLDGSPPQMSFLSHVPDVSTIDGVDVIAGNRAFRLMPQQIFTVLSDEQWGVRGDWLADLYRENHALRIQFLDEAGTTEPGVELETQLAHRAVAVQQRASFMSLLGEAPSPAAGLEERNVAMGRDLAVAAWRGVPRMAGLESSPQDTVLIFRDQPELAVLAVQQGLAVAYEADTPEATGLEELLARLPAPKGAYAIGTQASADFLRAHPEATPLVVTSRPQFFALVGLEENRLLAPVRQALTATRDFLNLARGA